MINRDIIVALVVLAGSIALYIAQSRIVAQAAVFIRVVVLAMIVLSLLLLVQTVIKRVKEKQVTGAYIDLKKIDFVWKPVLLIAGGILLYMTVMQDLGFYVSGFLYFVAVTFVLDWKGLTFKTGFFRTVYAFAFMLVIYVLFSKILVVQTPRGLLI